MDEQTLRAYLNDFREVAMNIDKFIDATADRERQAKDRADTIARAHRDGWTQVARAVQQGFELVAAAIRSR